MGITNVLEDYTTGVPIQSAATRSQVIVSGWQSVALVKEDSITVFKNSVAYYFDSIYHPLPSGDGRRPGGADILSVMRQTKHFLK